MRKTVQAAITEEDPTADYEAFPKKKMRERLTLVDIFRNREPTTQDFLVPCPPGWSKDTEEDYDWYEGQYDEDAYDDAYNSWDNQEELEKVPLEEFSAKIRDKLMELGVREPSINLGAYEVTDLEISYERDETDEEYMKRYKKHLALKAREEAERKEKIARQTAEVTAKLEKLKEAGVDIAALLKEQAAVTVAAPVEAEANGQGRTKKKKN